MKKKSDTGTSPTRQATAASAKQQSATARRALKADPSSRPHQPLTCQRVEELVLRFANHLDCADDAIAALIELIEGIAYEQDSTHRDLLAVGVRLRIFPHTQAYGQADEAFFEQGRN